MGPKCLQCCEHVAVTDRSVWFDYGNKHEWVPLQVCRQCWDILYAMADSARRNHTVAAFAYIDTAKARLQP